MQRTVALISLGCAKNLVNSEQMLALLTDAGYTLAPEADGADAVVVNTCGFIDAAKREAIDTILELADLKNAERLRAIIVAGCLAERYRDDIISDMPEVDAVVGVGSFSEIVSAVDAALAGERTVFAARAEDADDNLPRVLTAPGAWTYLKIADGCDNACAFCVIPSIRGSYRSREMSDIAAEAEELSARGVRELILIAQDTTRYGADLYGAPSLALLLARLEQIPLLRWIRVHYMYPDMVNDALLDKFASSEKLLPYFDIPIQHINDG
ncbi:MAG: MiaB/RimO family radical SAM methylthiotransferase, partial [Oscillospiraceae bacterium]|nr:MiaB/RimO family radical SAM methylthiotransferase [Oscillospiraceae bacterium]